MPTKHSKRKSTGTGSGKLQVLARAPKLQTLFVIISGVGTEEPESWSNTGCEPWFFSVPSQIAPGLGVYIYRHEVVNSNDFSWQTLLRRGDPLVKSVLRLVEEEKLGHCPILLVSHSLGGFIVKEALRLNYEHSQGSIKTLAGTILFGTPHSTSDDENAWQDVSSLMSSQKKRSISTEDLKRLAKSSLDFEHATVPIPILSVYEKKETKINRGPLSRSKKVLLVDETFAKTGSPAEEMIGINSDHFELCNVDVESGEFAEICKFIDIALEDARLSIFKGLSIYNAPSVFQDDWSELDSSETSNSQSKDQARSQDRSDPTTHSAPQTLYATAGTSDAGFEFITDPSQDTFNQPGLQLPCYIIPVTRNKEFFGRKDILDKLDEVFITPHQASADGTAETKTYAICGPGGMGKTQIAAEYVLTRKAKFDVIFWIHADEASKLGDAFSRIALALGLVAANSTDAEDPVVTRELTKGWLSNPVKNSDPQDEEVDKQASWLIVFDNVDDPDVLEDYWPIDGPGCALFTTRDSLATNLNFLATAGIDLPPFNVREASEFLERLTHRDGDSHGVSERLGGLPLAITQMASVIIRRDLSFSEFVASYDEEESHEDYLKGVVNWRSGYKKTLWSVWALESLKHGGTLLDVLSLFDPDGIPENILIKNPDCIQLAAYPKTKTAYQKARTELLQSSLLTKNNQSQELRIHRLVQDAARAKMDARRLREVFSAALSLLSSVWPFQSGWTHGVERWRLCHDLFPHVQRLKYFGERFSSSKGTFATDLEFCRLLTDAGWYYHETGYFEDSKSYLELAQEWAISLKTMISQVSNPGSELFIKYAKDINALIAETHHNLGCIGTETNDPIKTLQHFKTFNELMVKEIDGEGQQKDSRYAISWNELGNAYMMNGDYKKGKECFEKSLKAAEALDNCVPTSMSFPWVNLGLAYWLMDEYDEAVKALARGLDQREAAFGINDSQSFVTGRFLYALGNVKESQGSLVESFLYHQRALNQFLSTIGKNHHRTGDVRVRVADHFVRLGRYEEASFHLKEALRIFGDRQIFRSEKARATFRISELFRLMQKADEADSYLDEAATIYHTSGRASNQPIEGLQRKHFDELVAFWSR